MLNLKPKSSFASKSISVMLVLTLMLSLLCPAFSLQVQAAEDLKQPYNLNNGSYNLKADGTPVVNNDFVKTSTELVYADGVEPSAFNHHPVADDTVIMPTYKLAMKISYEIGIKTLDDHGYKLTYAIPEGYSVPDTTLDMEIKGEKVGEAQFDSANNSITFIYEKEKLSYTAVSYDVFVNAPVNMNAVDESHNTVTITFGEFTKEVSLDPRYVVANINVNIEKVKAGDLVKHGDDYYIPFSVTVALFKDCERLYVVDFAHLEDEATSCVEGFYDTNFNQITATAIPANGTFGEVYLGTVANSQKPVKSASADTMVWEITDVMRFTEYNFNYYIKVNDKYPTKGQDTAVENKATVYTALKSDTEPDVFARGDDDASYVPTPSAEIKKRASNTYIQADDNGYYVDYTVTVKNTSGYDIDHFDVFDWMFYDDMKNPDNNHDYADYITDSFTIDDVAVPSDEIAIGEYSDPNRIRKLYGYKLCIGEFSVGQTKTLKYRLKIKPEFTYSKNGEVSFTNYADVRTHGSTVNLAETNAQVKTYKQWSRKSREDVESAVTVNMTDGNIYNSSKTQVTSPTSFAVPENSSHYTVVVNEDGKHIMTNANFKDRFTASNNIMAYVGYARVRAYDTYGKCDNLGGNANETTNVTKKVQECRLVGTAYYQINGGTSFAFKPGELGIGGKYAYIIDYYAAPTENTSAVVSNEFIITGSVGGFPGGNEAYITMSATNTFEFEGNMHCDVVDIPFGYVLPGDEGTYTIQNKKYGALYWVVKVTGDLADGMTIFDRSELQHSRFENDWLVGVYTGTSAATFPKDKTIEEVAEANNLTEFNSYVKAPNSSNSEVGIVLTENPCISDGQALYMVVKTRCSIDTENGVKPTAGNYISGNHYTINNYANYKYANNEKLTEVSTSQRLYTHKGLLKNADGETGVYRYDGKTWTTDKKDGTKEEITGLPTPKNNESGIYLGWDLHVNVDGILNGAVTVVDSLPDGVVLDSLELIGVDASLSDSQKPGSQSPDFTHEGLNKNDFTEYDIINNSVKYSNGNNIMSGAKYYYDAKSNKLVFGVMINSPAINENQSAVANRFAKFRVLCKVTDTQFLDNQSLGQNENQYTDPSKTFRNTVTMYSSIGKTYRVSDISIKADALSKEGNLEKAKRTGIYHFTINANPLGMDLVKDSEVITVCDKLSNALTFKEKTVVIKNSNGTPVSSSLYNVNVTPQADGSTLVEFDIPDSMILTIEYDAKITIPDGSSSVSISNEAYWKGESPAADSTVRVPSFALAPSGWGDGYATKGTLDITLVNSNGVPMKNCEFEISKVTVTDDGITTTETVKKTTDSNGKITVDDLDYNQIYSVKQVTTNSNYIKEENPHYITITNTYGGYASSYDKLLEDIDALTDEGVSVECEYNSDKSSTVFVNNIVGIIGATLFIENKIGVNFYVYFGGKAVQQSDGRYVAEGVDTAWASKFEMRMKFKDKNGNYLDEKGNITTAENAYVEIKRFDERELNFLQPSSTTGMMPLFRFTHWNYAFEMADTIEAAMYMVDGEQAKCVTQKPVDYSIKKYAENMLSKDTTSTKLAKLLVSMLNYGSYSQRYWNHNTNNLANSGLTSAMLKKAGITSVTNPDTIVTSVTQISDDYNISKTEGISGINVNGMALRFDRGASFDVKLTVSTEKGHDLGAFTTVLSSGSTKFFMKDGVQVALPYEISEEEFVSTGKDGVYTLTLYNLPVYRWDNDVTLTFTSKENSEQKYSVTFSLNSYIYKALEGQVTNTKLLNLLKSMYLYNQESQPYFNTLEEVENQYGLPTHGAGAPK